MGNALSAAGSDFLRRFADVAPLPPDVSEILRPGVAHLDGVITAPRGTSIAADALATGTFEDNLWETLFLHTVETNRIGDAIAFATDSLDHALAAAAAATAANEGEAVAAAAGLHTVPALRFAQILIGASVQRAQGNPFQLDKYVNRRGETTKLISVCIGAVLKLTLPKSSEELRLLAEVLLILLTVNSTALQHAPLEDGHSPDRFTDWMLLDDGAPLIPELLWRLIITVTYWGQRRLVTTYEYEQDHRPGFHNLYNLFGIARRGRRVNLSDVVGLRSLDLLLVLLLYRKPTTGHGNAAVTALRAMRDSEEIVDLRELLAAIETRAAPDCPELCLLLYVLLQHQSQSVTQILPDTAIVTAQLHVAYLASAPPPPAPSHSPKPVDALNLAAGSTGIANTVSAQQHDQSVAPTSFLAGTNLLQMTKHQHIVQQWFATPCHVPWFKDCLLGSISVGSLLIIICARAIRAAMRGGAADLAEVYLSVIANVAPFSKEFHVLAAQRLSQLLKRLLKDISRRTETLAKNPDDYAAQAAREASTELAVTLLSSISAMLAGPHLQENYSLMYELLHEQQILLDAKANGTAVEGTTLGDALAPLATLVSKYNVEVRSVSETHTVEDIMAVIKRTAAEAAPAIVTSGASRSPAASPGPSEVSFSTAGTNGATTTTITGSARSSTEMVFEYTEDENAYDFFAPLLWSYVMSRSATKSVAPLPVTKASAASGATAAGFALLPSAE